MTKAGEKSSSAIKKAAKASTASKKTSTNEYKRRVHYYVTNVSTAQMQYVQAKLSDLFGRWSWLAGCHDTALKRLTFYLRNHGNKINVEKTKTMISEVLCDKTDKRDVFVILNDETSDDKYLTRQLKMGHFDFTFGELRTKATKGKKSAYVDGRGDWGDEANNDTYLMFEQNENSSMAKKTEQEKEEFFDCVG